MAWTTLNKGFKGQDLGESIPSTFVFLLQVAWDPQFPISIKSPPLVYEEIVVVCIASGPRRYTVPGRQGRLENNTPKNCQNKNKNNQVFCRNQQKCSQQKM